MSSISRFYNVSVFFSALIYLIFMTHIAFSQYSPLETEGGVDTHLYKTDTVMFDATAMEDGSGSIGKDTFSAGLRMLHSPYLSILQIPLKYGLNDNFQLSFSLPFLTKTIVYNNTHYIKSGYGDTMLGFTGSFQILDSVLSSTTARITLPTGNVNAQDFGTYIPLGYGGYTASLQQGISTRSIETGPASIRLFIGGIGIYYFISTMQVDATEKYTYDKTYAWALTGGIELGLTKNLDFQIKGNYINLAERRYKSSSSPDQWIDANDEIKQINILPFIKYRFLNDITGQLGIIYPIKTTQDPNISPTYDPKWKIAFEIEKRFGNDAISENKLKEKKSKEVKAQEVIKVSKDVKNNNTGLSTGSDDSKESKYKQTKKKKKKKRSRQSQD